MQPFQLFLVILCGVTTIVAFPTTAIHAPPDVQKSTSTSSSLQELEATSSPPIPSQCTDPAGFNSISPECWILLNVTQYLTHWPSTHGKTCHPGTPFVQCFLEALDLGEKNCADITFASCPPPAWSDLKNRQFTSSLQDLQDYYVLFNIYSVWTFFNGYWAAIGNAGSLATTSVGAIVALLDPPKKTNGLLSNILTALSAAFSLLSLLPDLAPLTKAVVAGIQHAPSIGEDLFPTGTLDSRVAQFDQIENAVGTVSEYLQGNITSALAAIQKDAATFLAVTHSGSFSTPAIPSIPDQSHAILQGLETYIISQCLTANDWVIARAIDTDIHALQTNNTQPNWNIPGCSNDYDNKSTCGAYYYDTATDVTYTLTNTKNPSLDPTSDMLQFFANWTTPDLLFNGAVQCQAQGGSDPSVRPGAESVIAFCLSSMKVCTWDLNPSHTDTSHEFTDCPTQKGFAVDGCKDCDDGDICINVPFSYVGNYLMMTSEELTYQFCNKDGNVLGGDEVP